jgi:hypothetical protein
LNHEKIKMRDFLNYAYFAIMYMNEFCPGMGVGVEPGDIPDIKYLFYNQEWDIEPAKHPSLGQDINDAKNYVDNKLGQIRQPFKDIFLDGE